jgi:hypothetical protein
MAEEQKAREGRSRRLYVLTWKEGRTKHEVTTPLLEGEGAAYVWLFEQKPHLIHRFTEIKCVHYRNPLWKKRRG